MSEKYYRKDIGKRKKEFIKVYQKMPESIPEVFRKGTLVAYDLARITKNRFAPKYCEVHYQEHTMTGQETIDKMLKWQCVEITEEEYNKSVSEIRRLIQEIEPVFDKL